MNDRPGKRPKLFHSFSRISKPPTSSTQGASTSAAAVTGGQTVSDSLYSSSAPAATHLPDPALNNTQYPPAAPNPTAICERWAGLRRISNMLINGPIVFGPLKQAVEGVLSLVETFEREAESREDYRMLRTKLNKLFYSLAGCLGASIPAAMTSAIADLARHMHAGTDADKVLKHYRVIQGLLEDFMLNASVNIWRTVDEQAT
ncbi:hypothetical protein FRC07_012202, partial [Ceratobasidium sp. 392]